MPGDRLELVQRLGQLAELEIDAVLAYQQALASAQLPEAQELLGAIQRAHQSCLAELNVMVQELGGTPPAATREFRGYRSEGLTAPAPGAADAQNLQALRANEKLAERLYADSVELSRSGPIQDLLRRGRQESERHRRALEKLLASGG